jgi:hypothetical protein
MLRDFTQEQFDIIIQAGQSNAVGLGYGDATNPFAPSQDILYLNDDFSICQAHEGVKGNLVEGNFALAFCAKYIESGKLQKGRKLLVIRAAVGGTGFSDHRWGIHDDLFLKMVDMIETALALNPANKLTAMLWHQGESDVGIDKQIHYSALIALVRSVRAMFKNDRLPFMAADFVNQWKIRYLDICGQITEAMREVCADVGYARFIETDELESNDQKIHDQDFVHFCREANNQLGIKYFQAFCDIAGSLRPTST